MRLRTLVLLFPWLWLFVTLVTRYTGHPWTSNQSNVKRVGLAISDFQKDQNRLPETLSELREYVLTQGEEIDLFDNFGQKLFYLPLTETIFFVKSFGRDGAENTVLISKDETFSSGINFPPKGIKLDLPTDSRLNFYQGLALDGLESPKGEWIASLKSRFRGGVKRLIIQSVLDKQFIMASAHDAVEEFLWLSSGSEIIFTAQGSSRYEDGLYYWNLQTNQTYNLLPEIRQLHFPNLAEDKKLLLSLSHVGTKPEFLYFFMVPEPSDSSIDPKEFYRYKNFFALNVKENFKSERVNSDMDYSIFDYSLDHKSLVKEQEAQLALPAQIAWLNIHLHQDKQTLLEAWQSYCSTHATSASLPYALWWLASIYSDTLRSLLKDSPEQARTVRNFALEIADALSQLPSSPRYLRVFAESLKKSLLLSKPATYNVTPLEIENSDTEIESQALPATQDPPLKANREGKEPGADGSLEESSSKKP